MKTNIEDTKEEALEVLSDLNESLRHTGMFEALGDERFDTCMGNCEVWDGLALARASKRRAVSGIHNLNSFPLILNMPGAYPANESVLRNMKATITILYSKLERIK